MKEKDYPKTLNSLVKLLIYILNHRPDEFGLFLDKDGFVPLKELHQAIIEEKGWSFVRKSHLMDAINFADPEQFELNKDNRIKAVYGHTLPGKNDLEPAIPPKVLYHAATRKSYPHILKKGLLPAHRQYVHLTINKELALRIGRRRDNKPVLLEIMACRAARMGINFFCPNQLIYLVESLPPSYISGPHLHKVQSKSPAKPSPAPSPPTPGSFVLTADMLVDFPKGKQDRTKRHARKKGRRGKR